MGTLTNVLAAIRKGRGSETTIAPITPTTRDIMAIMAAAAVADAPPPPPPPPPPEVDSFEARRKTWGTKADPFLAEWKAPKLPMTREFLQEFAKRAGVELMTAEEKSKVRDVGRRYDELTALTIELSRAMHKPGKFAASRLSALLDAGRDGEFVNNPMQTAEEIGDQLRSKVRATKAKRREIVAELFPLAIAVTARIQEAAKRLCEHEEAEERKRCEALGVEHTPGALVRVLRQLSWLPERMLPAGGIASHPRDLLALCWIDFDEVRKESPDSAK